MSSPKLNAVWLGLVRRSLVRQAMAGLGMVRRGRARQGIDRGGEVSTPFSFDVNWGGEGYAEYQGWMKVSSGEKTAANQQAGITTSLQSDAQTLQTMAQSQFQEQQSLLNNVLIPQL